MLPHSGKGVIWDRPPSADGGIRAHLTIFVPESKKLHNVSISLSEVKFEDIHPADWMKWSGVGARDAVKPAELIGVRMMEKLEEKPLHVEFVNQTTFKTTLLFPDRPDLVAFVGEKNAWSYDVGIVNGETVMDPERGIHCTAYIRRDYAKTGSAFIIDERDLKYPEGFGSTREQEKFEGMIKMIEWAMEEAEMLAQKGKNPDAYEPILSVGTKPKDDDEGAFGRSKHNLKGVRKDTPHLNSWSKGKSKEEHQRIVLRNDLLVGQRFHHVIVYKASRGKGFVGFIPSLGSVPIVAEMLKNDNRCIKIGDFLHTRVELNKRINRYVVEQAVDIVEPHCQIKIENEELMITVERLEVSELESIEGKRSRFDGYLTHPEFLRILCCEKDIEQWKGKRVNAVVRHSENMAGSNPNGIFLVMERIIGEFDEKSRYDKTSKEPIIVGKPDDICSDDEDDFEDDEEEKSEGGRNEKDKKGGEKWGESSGWGGGEGGDDWSCSAFDRNRRHGKESAFGGERERRDGGRGRGDGGDRRRVEGGRQNENRSQYGNRSQSNNSPEWGDEGHGFGFDDEPSAFRKNQIFDRGLVVCYSKKSSVIYTKEHKLVEFEGDISLQRVNIGDTVEFGMIPSTQDSTLPYKVVRGSLQKCREENRMPVDSIPRNGELYIRTYAILNVHRNIFATKDVSDVRIDLARLGLRSGDRHRIPKSRLLTDHWYEIFVKFSGDHFCWEFDSLDDSSPSYQLEEEDEIEKIKQQNYEDEKRRERRERGMESSEESWEKVDNGSQYGMSQSIASTQITHTSPHYSDDRSRYSVPSRPISKAPSVASVSTQRTLTPSELSQKELINLQRELKKVKGMLKTVWQYKEVHQVVKQDNFFLYESIDDWARHEQEDLSMQQQ